MSNASAPQPSRPHKWLLAKLQRGTLQLLAASVVTSIVSLSAVTVSAADPNVSTTPAGPAVSSRHIMADRFDYPTGRWRMGAGRGVWSVVFDGYGWVGIKPRSRNELTLMPGTATRPQETHASLVVSRTRYQDFTMTAIAATARQLRVASAPNPWETAWLVWHYKDNMHFYYLALKTNGWELGKADPAYPGAQRFLATGTSPRARIGRTDDVRISQRGAITMVWIDGEHVVTFTDQERPYRGGRIGFYTEDAEVRFSDVVIDSIVNPHEAK